MIYIYIAFYKVDISMHVYKAEGKEGERGFYNTGVLDAKKARTALMGKVQPKSTLNIRKS